MPEPTTPKTKETLPATPAQIADKPAIAKTAQSAIAGFTPPASPLKAVLHEGAMVCTQEPYSGVPKMAVNKECEGKIVVLGNVRGYTGFTLTEELKISDELKVGDTVVQKAQTIPAGTPLFVNVSTNLVALELKPIS